MKRFLLSITALLMAATLWAPARSGAAPFGPDMPGWATSDHTPARGGGDGTRSGSDPASEPDRAGLSKSEEAGIATPSGDDGREALEARPDGSGRKLSPIRAERNERVEKWIDFYTGRGREDFQRWLLRSGRYMGFLTRILHAEGMPGELANLVFVESGFNMHARSVARAVGPWQFIRGTAKIFGLQMTPYVDERRDPERATRAAARYLRRLYGMFDGSWPLALAAFNSGEGTVQRAIRRQGTSDYWSLRLPRETEEYVPQFLAAMEIAAHPDRYGFEAPEHSLLEFDEVVIRGPVDLKLIANLTSVPMEELQHLNPMLVRPRIPPAGRDGTALRVPVGQGDSIRDTLEERYRPKPLTKAELRAAKYAHRLEVKRSMSRRGRGHRTHLVRSGETLSQIGQRYGASPKSLARLNGIKSPRDLRAGQRIRIR